MPRTALTVIGMVALTACDQPTSTATTAQLANPAAAFCVESGARYKIRDGDNGQYGVCILADGREMDAWEYFRENNPA